MEFHSVSAENGASRFRIYNGTLDEKFSVLAMTYHTCA